MNFAKHSSFGIFIVLICLVMVFQLLNPIFLSPINVQTMLRSMAYTGIIAVGMAICLMSGVIDLSVGSTAALASVIFGKAMVSWGE